MRTITTVLSQSLKQVHVTTCIYMFMRSFHTIITQVDTEMQIPNKSKGLPIVSGWDWTTVETFEIYCGQAA